jgi:origin recognition complex subunit 6
MLPIQQLNKRTFNISRLKTKLNLPTIVVRPPVGPKTYKKVYAYLDSALTAGTPRKQQKHSLAPHREPSTPSKERIQSVNGTPSKTPSRTPLAKTPASARSSTKRKRVEGEEDDDIPGWTMSAIRSLCKAFSIPQVAPHVFVGVSSIVRSIREKQAAVSATPSKKRARRSVGDDAPSAVTFAFDDTYIPALVAVIGFFTRSHLLGAPEPEEYATQRATAMKAISKALPDGAKQTEEDMIPIIEVLLREAENGWLDMEWYHNLPEPASDAEAEAGNRAKGNEDAEEVMPGPSRSLEVPKRGFGSMMTDATDYLSEEKKAEYKRWKNGIMRRIAQSEKQDKGKAIKV